MLLKLLNWKSAGQPITCFRCTYLFKFYRRLLCIVQTMLSKMFVHPSVTCRTGYVCTYNSFTVECHTILLVYTKCYRNITKIAVSVVDFLSSRWLCCLRCSVHETSVVHHHVVDLCALLHTSHLQCWTHSISNQLV